MAEQPRLADHHEGEVLQAAERQEVLRGTFGRGGGRHRFCKKATSVVIKVLDSHGLNCDGMVVRRLVYDALPW